MQWQNNGEPMLSDYIGQDRAIEALKIEMSAAINGRTRLPHMLFLGPPGTGKTTLAKSVSKEMFVPFEVLHCPNVDDRQKVTDSIMKAQGGILFLEEIHALNRQFAEDLYTVTDTNEVTVYEEITEKRRTPVVVQYENGLQDIEWGEAEVGTGRYESRTRPIQPVTIIGATTDEARLPEAFLSRLSGLIVRLQPYTEEALSQIAVSYAKERGYELGKMAAKTLAQSSRQNPRRVKQFVDRCVSASTRKTISARTVGDTLVRLGVDMYGLEEPHRRLLSILYKEPQSKASLAQKMGIPTKNIDLYFGELSKLGMVTINRKHEITDLGMETLSGF